jgi:hypothetical protein
MDNSATEEFESLDFYEYKNGLEGFHQDNMPENNNSRIVLSYFEEEILWDIEDWAFQNELQNLSTQEKINLYWKQKLNC